VENKGLTWPSWLMWIFRYSEHSFRYQSVIMSEEVVI